MEEHRWTEAEILRHRRNVDDPCPRCHGWGVCSYSSTATWRGGMGGQSFTSDICDVCWGSGDEHRHGTDIRALERKYADWERDQCMAYFARQTGANMSTTKAYMAAIATFLDSLERKRKIPDGCEEFWWRMTVHAVAAAFRRFAA